jgi:RNA-directed DNA polymerase
MVRPERRDQPRQTISRKVFKRAEPLMSRRRQQTAIRAEIRSWNLHSRSDKSIEDLSRMFNPIIRGVDSLAGAV